MSVAAAPAASSRSDWKRWPETEAFVDRLIDRGLEGNAFAADLADRMTGRPARASRSGSITWSSRVRRAGRAAMAALGYERQPMAYSVGVPVFAHPGGIFPRIALVRVIGRQR